jgi:hypothetical protein
MDSSTMKIATTGIQIRNLTPALPHRNPIAGFYTRLDGGLLDVLAKNAKNYVS